MMSRLVKLEESDFVNVSEGDTLLYNYEDGVFSLKAEVIVQFSGPAGCYVQVKKILSIGKKRELPGYTKMIAFWEFLYRKVEDSA